jgi:hypothetical protein
MEQQQQMEQQQMEQQQTEQKTMKHLLWKVIGK